MAAVTVLVGHIVQIFFTRLIGVDHWLPHVTGYSAQGAVIVFFLLSGYLITLSIRANIDRNGRFMWAEYLASRIARIYPPLIGAILVTVAAWAIVQALGLPGSTPYRLPTDLYAAREYFTLTPRDVGYAIAMQNGMLEANGPLWSLCMEWHIYIIAMLLVLRTGWSIALGAALFAAWVWLTPTFAIYTTVWLVGAALAFTRLPRLMRVPNWLASTGDWSYSLYVIHFPMLLLTLSIFQRWMQNSGWRTVVATVIAAPTICALAYLFSRYFEEQRRFRPFVLRCLHVFHERQISL